MYIEIYTYFLLWILCVTYSLYCFSFTTYQYFKDYEDQFNDFTTDLQYFSKRDKADLEWESITFLIKYYFPLIFVYLIISQSIRSYIKSVKVLKVWQIIFTISYILIKWNYKFLAVILLQPVLFYIVNYLKFNSFLIWTTSGFSLVILNYFKKAIDDPEVFELFNINDYEMYILISSLFWINLRSTSFCLEHLTSVKTIVDILSYTLYPPTVLTGPFILYKDYENIYELQKCNFKKCIDLLKNICRTMFWYIFSFICLHFVYVNAAGFHLQLVEKFDNWSLCGYGYTMGQYFHLKYVILYGMSTSFASFENICVPNLPRCIGRIHLYSDMWKYFDPGLYKFLVRNIYLPSIPLSQNKVIRSLICFFFVYIWHGLEAHILIWTILNYSGILFEDIWWPKERGKTDDRKTIQEQSWKRRMDCFVAAFLLAMSSISNFYFFAGVDVGNVFFKRIFSGSYGNVILIGALYCCCQVSTELKFIKAAKM